MNHDSSGSRARRAGLRRSAIVAGFYFTRAPSQSALIHSNRFFIKLGQWVAPANPSSPRSCMRAHGFPSYPDPDVQNGSLVREPLPTSIDTSSPQFQAAQQICHPTI
jgi:hypothetical protein